MEKFSGFTWGYLFPVCKLAALVPYLNCKKNNSWLPDKWQMFTVMHILFVIFVAIGYNKLVSFFYTKEIFVLAFQILDIFGYPLSIIFNFLIILKRGPEIYSTLEYFSKTMKNLTNLLPFSKRKTRILNFLFYYFICQVVVNFCIAFFNSYDTYLGIFYPLTLLYSNCELLLMDLNFCVFVLNAKYLFQIFNEKLQNIKKGKKKEFSKESQKFRGIYEDCCGIVGLIEKCFVSAAFINTVIEFSGFVYGAYGIYCIPTFINVIHVAYWTSFYMCKIVVKLYVCSSTTKEVNLFH